MLLATGAIFELMKFAQIFFWIILPVFAIAIAVTVWLHKRKKKKNAETDQDHDQVFSLPEKDSYVLFDHSGLIRQYKNKLSLNEARFTALQYDFDKLDKKYAALADYASLNLANNKNSGMENSNLNEEITRLADQHMSEKKELLARLEQLGRSYKSLEEENESLTTQLKLSGGTDEDRATLLNRWIEEKKELKDKITEHEWMEEMLKEKKNQIEFLQNQLEQRIKTHHHVEHNKVLLNDEIENLKEANRETLRSVDALKAELLLKDEVADKLQSVIAEKEEQLDDRRLLINSKQDQIAYLENTLKETKSQNEMLNAEGSDTHDQLSTLHTQLEDQQSRILFLEQKLASNKQTLKRLHKEFSNILQDEEQGQLVPMREVS